MTQEELLAAAAACTHNLPDHRRKTIPERMREIADSPYAEGRADHYGNGGFVAKFETEIAELLGKEAAVLMPSGTMAQQIALRIWADRASNRTVAFHPTCHLEKYEHMAYRELHGLEAELLGDADRLFTLEQLMALGKPISSLLIELPQREIGGALPSWDELKQITQYAMAEGIKLHLDGARLWECQPFYQRPYAEIVEDFGSVYVSFYKILFGLPGAALAGPKDFIDEARIWMRRHGGNLVHMFPTAISAKIGMERYLPEIPLYVAKAAEVAEILGEFEGVQVIPKAPPTNLMHLHWDAPVETVMEAVGQIALLEKVFLFSHASPRGSGSKTEITIASAGLEIPAERLRELFGQLFDLFRPNRAPSRR